MRFTTYYLQLTTCNSLLTTCYLSHSLGWRKSEVGTLRKEIFSKWGIEFQSSEFDFRIDYLSKNGLFAEFRLPTSDNLRNGFTTHYSLLTTRYSLPTTHDSPLTTTHYSLPTTHDYSLVTTYNLLLLSTTVLTTRYLLPATHQREESSKAVEPAIAGYCSAVVRAHTQYQLMCSPLDSLASEEYGGDYLYPREKEHAMHCVLGKHVVHLPVPRACVQHCVVQHERCNVHIEPASRWDGIG